MGMMIPGRTVKASIHADAIFSGQPVRESLDQADFAIGGQAMGQGNLDFTGHLGIVALCVNFDFIPKEGTVSHAGWCSFRKDQGKGFSETFPCDVPNLACALIGDF